MWQIIRAVVVVLLLFGIAACGGPNVSVPKWQLSDIIKELLYLRAKTAQLEAQINDGLTLALCSPELRQLLDDVQRECMATPTNKAGAQCTTTQIRGAVMNADPEHKGRFLKLMSHLPHEVLYLAKGGSEALPYRIERLDRLTKPALLQNTIFLVVSSPESGDAEAARRAELVEQWLQARKIPPRAIRRWMYAFPANRADITRQSDQPGLFEAKELHRGVWVFRADC